MIERYPSRLFVKVEDQRCNDCMTEDIERTSNSLLLHFTKPISCSCKDHCLFDSRNYLEDNTVKEQMRSRTQSFDSTNNQLIAMWLCPFHSSRCLVLFAKVRAIICLIVKM